MTKPTTEDTAAGKPTSPEPVKPDETNPNGNLTGGLTPKPEPDGNPEDVPSPTPDDVKPDESKNGEPHKPASPQPPEPDQTTPGPKPDSVPPEPVLSKKEWMKSKFLKFFSVNLKLVSGMSFRIHTITSGNQREACFNITRKMAQKKYYNLNNCVTNCNLIFNKFQSSMLLR